MKTFIIKDLTNEDANFWMGLVNRIGGEAYVVNSEVFNDEVLLYSHTEYPIASIDNVAVVRTRSKSDMDVLLEFCKNIEAKAKIVDNEEDFEDEMLLVDMERDWESPSEDEDEEDEEEIKDVFGK